MITEAEIKKLSAAVQDLQRTQRAQPAEIIISGVTNPTAHTQQLFGHKLGAIPSRYYPIQGNIYVYSMTENSIDVRSAQTSVTFALIIS